MPSGVLPDAKPTLPDDTPKDKDTPKDTDATTNAGDGDMVYIGGVARENVATLVVTCEPAHWGGGPTGAGELVGY